MSNESKVELGDEAKDKVSGFKGIIFGKHIYLNGCSRFSIQPKINNNGEMLDFQTFDEPQIEIIKKEKVKFNKSNYLNRIDLGDRVKDKVSGFNGIIVAKHIYLNDSMRFTVQPKIDKDGKLPGTISFYESSLDVIEKEKIKYTQEPENKEIPGGPEKYMPGKRPGE